MRPNRRDLDLRCGFRVDSKNAFVDALVGSGVGYVGRLARIHTDYGMIADPKIFHFKSLRAMLLVLTEVFEADRRLVTRNDLDRLAPNYEQGAAHLTPAWLSYVAPRFVPLIFPPSTATVELRPDGGLLMASTTDTLDVGNPEHVQAAFDIAAACRALRAFGR